MEGFGFIIFLIFGYWIVNLLINTGFKGGAAVVESVTKGGTVAENFSKKLQVKIEHSDGAPGISEVERVGYALKYLVRR